MTYVTVHFDTHDVFRINRAPMHTGLDCARAGRARLPSVAPRRAAVAGCVGGCDCSPVVDFGVAARPPSSVGVPSAVGDVCLRSGMTQPINMIILLLIGRTI